MTCYILVKAFPPPSAHVDFIPRVPRGSPEPHEAGSLFKELHRKENLISCEKLCTDEPNHSIDILMPYLEELNQNELELLRAIPAPDRNRLMVWSDKKWLREGVTLKEGSSVYICNHKTLARDTEGVVRYRGSLPAREGVWFGVELAPRHAGEGTTDGYFRHQQFFTCADDCGVFVTIYSLRSNEFAALKRRDYTSVEDEEVPSVDLSCFAFKMEDRVVWMSDEGPQNGTIKWIGRLPESESVDIVVGVYFDKAVGSGTGRYKGRQLFETPHGHASLMPPLGLIAFADFYGDRNPDTEFIERFKLMSYDTDIGQDSCYMSDTSSASLAKRSDPDIIQGAPSTYPREGQLKARSPLLASGVSSSTMPQLGTLDQPLTHMPALPYHFDIGSKVYTILKEKRYGVIRYIGKHPKKAQREIAGIEMEAPDASCYTDGEFAGVKLFDCPPKRAFFVYLELCHPDDRARNARKSMPGKLANNPVGTHILNVGWTSSERSVPT